MACFESLLARRVLLWYILLVSFVIFPLSLTLSLGCKFMVTGIDDSTRQEYQAFGIFNAAVYDVESPGRDFLGCVDYSQFLKEQTNDIAFRGAKFAGGFLLAFSTLATVINLCLQCFSKHGKSWLWGVTRLSYLVAFISQGAMYSVFASNVCTSMDGEASHCWVGKNGVAGVFNFLFLFGMVVATFNSFPPRNPVFQCWTGDFDHDSSVEVCSDEEDVESAMDVASRHDGSVSLFAPSKASSRHSSISKIGTGMSVLSKKSSAISIVGSQKSTKLSVVSEKSKKSSSSKMSRGSTKKRELLVGEPTIKENATEEEDKLSAAEEGDAQAEAVKSVSAVKKESTNNFVPSNSFRTNIAKRLWGSSKSKQKTVPPTIGDDNESFKPVAERVSKLETGLQYGRKTRAQTVQPPQPISLASTASVVKPREYAEGTGETDVTDAKAKQYPTDLEDSESIRFLKDLAAVTNLGKGGIRVKTLEKGHTVEIVDEYPAKAGEGLNAPHSNDGADVVKVRTEYYELGSRTTKEVTHHDGSRTVVTTINSIPGVRSRDGDSISTKQSEEKNAEPNLEAKKSGEVAAESLRSNGSRKRDSSKQSKTRSSQEQ